MKLGVDITRLKRQIRRALPKIEAVYTEISGEEVVISSTYEGNHPPRVPPLRKPCSRHPQSDLGPNYDVVEEGTHNHVEHDPKNSRRWG